MTHYKHSKINGMHHRTLKHRPYNIVFAVTKPFIKVKFKQIASGVTCAHEKIDDALGVISLNGTILQSVITEGHNMDKFQHGIQLLQNDFLFASKFMLISRVIGSFKATGTQKHINVAIYISLLFIVIFVSDR